MAACGWQPGISIPAILADQKHRRSAEPQQADSYKARRLFHDDFAEGVQRHHDVGQIDAAVVRRL